MIPVVAVALATAALAAALPVRLLVRGEPGRWTSRAALALLGGLGGAGAALLGRDWVEVATFAVLGLGCAVLVAVDLDCHRLPDAVALPTAGLLIAGLAAGASRLAAWDDLWRALLAGLVVGSGFLVMALASPRSLGLGDVKLAAILGVFLGWFGWSAVLTGVVATFLLGGVAAVMLLAFTRADRRTPLAFGPWLVLGTCVAGALTRLAV